MWRLDVDTVRIDKLEDKVDKLVELSHKQDIQLERLTGILEKNTESLITHEKRTTISEQRLEEFENVFIKHLMLVEKNFTFAKGAFWSVSLIVTLSLTLIKMGIIKV